MVEVEEEESVVVEDDDEESVEDEDRSEARSLSRLVAELFCVVVSPDCTALSSVARSETKVEAVESELSEEEEDAEEGGGGGGGACKWLSIVLAVDCAVVVSPDCTAETSVCRSERKPDWPSDEDDDELDESEVDDDCNRL